MSSSKGHVAKLPVKQLAILAVARFAEPLALTSVFPYLPEMIKSFGIPQNNVAKWAGIVGSTFSVSQSMFAVYWGRLSDKIGRKPTILIGLTSTMFCFLAWGLSTSLRMAIITRFLIGGGNGNVGILRTVVAELVPQKELQPQAFSLMPLVWSIGSVFGPSFGGFFARPAEQYPALFGDSWLLKKYPFFLPNLIACIFFFISASIAALFLHETLETKRHQKDWGLILGEKIARPFKRKPKFSYQREHRTSFADAEASAPLLPKSGVAISVKRQQDTEPPSIAEVFTPQVVICIVAYTFLALHSVAFDQVLPVFLNYPPQVPDENNTHLPFHFSGGFGLSSNKIGTIFTLYGLACGLIQFFIFPPICAYFGTLNCFKAATILYPISYVLVPYTALIQDPHTRYAVFLPIMLLKGVAGIMGFPCITILLTNSAPSVRILGTLNGFATTFSGVGRAVGPSATGAAFSWGVKRGSVVPAWWLLAAIACLQAVPAWMIVEGEGPSRAAADGGCGGSDDGEEIEVFMSDDDDDHDADDDDEEGRDDRAILAGDAEDMARAREEDDDVPELDEDFPPLARVNSRWGSPYGTADAAPPARGHPLRRMAAAGEDGGRDPRGVGCRPKRRGDDIDA